MHDTRLRMLVSDMVTQLQTCCNWAAFAAQLAVGDSLDQHRDAVAEAAARDVAQVLLPISATRAATPDNAQVRHSSTW